MNLLWICSNNLKLWWTKTTTIRWLTPHTMVFILASNHRTAPWLVITRILSFYLTLNSPCLQVKVREAMWEVRLHHIWNQVQFYTAKRTRMKSSLTSASQLPTVVLSLCSVLSVSSMARIRTMKYSSSKNVTLIYSSKYKTYKDKFRAKLTKWMYMNRNWLQGNVK